MPLLSKASNVVQNVFSCTGFTQICCNRSLDHGSLTTSTPAVSRKEQSKAALAQAIIPQLVTPSVGREGALPRRRRRCPCFAGPVPGHHFCALAAHTVRADLACTVRDERL